MRKKKKSNSKVKAWAAELLKDLIVAIIAAIVTKLLEQQRGAQALLYVKYNTLICKVQHERICQIGSDDSVCDLFWQGGLLFDTVCNRLLEVSS